MDIAQSSNRVINRFPPLNNITPFTRVDGWSFLEVLEGLRNYVVNTLVNEIDDRNKEITDRLNKWFDQYTLDFQNIKNEWQALFDKFMENVVAELEALNDQAMANLIRNALSETRKALEEEFYSRSIPIDNNVLGYRKSIKHNLPIQYPGFDNYVDSWGREQVPQSFTVDEISRELFIVYNSPMVVAVYDWDTGAFKTVFRAGLDNNGTVTEGMAVIREGLARYLYLRTGVGTMSRFNVTDLPSRGTSIPASADYPVTALGRTYCYDGKYFYITDSSSRDVIRRLDSGFNDNGVVKIASNMAGWTGELENSMSSATPKIQGFTVTRGGLFTAHGGYYQTGSVATPYQMQGLRQYSLHGDLLGEWLLDTKRVAEKFFESGELQFMPRVFENEGVTLVGDDLYSISFTHGYNASEAEIASVEGILIIQEFSTEPNAIDFSLDYRNPIVADNTLVGFVKDIRNRIMNQVTGQPLTTIAELAEYMALIGQQYGEYYSSTTRVVDTSGFEIPLGHMVKISMGSSQNFIIEIVGVDSHARRLYKTDGVWVENRLVTPGALPLIITLDGASGVYNPTYRRENTEIAVDGAVSLSSAVTPGFGNYHTIATLPDGFRPSKMQYYPTQIASSAVSSMCRVQVNGDIQVAISTATTASILLTGIRFRSTVVI